MIKFIKSLAIHIFGIVFAILWFIIFVIMLTFKCTIDFVLNMFDIS